MCTITLQLHVNFIKSINYIYMPSILNLFNSVINELTSLFLMWDSNFRPRPHDPRPSITTTAYPLDARA